LENALEIAEDGVGDEDEDNNNYDVEDEDNNNYDVEDDECVVCLARERSYIFIQCGHLCVCENCEVYLERCPICREYNEKQRVFFVNLKESSHKIFKLSRCIHNYIFSSEV